MARECAEGVIPAVERILTVIPPEDYDEPDLELLFTHLDLAEMDSPVITLADVKWTELRPKFIRLIWSAFFVHQLNVQEQALTAYPVLDRWAAHLHEDDTIITFNWDILHEVGLVRSGKWHYADGYGFPSADAREGEHSAIKVLKLHGSINWSQRGPCDCQPAILYKRDFFPGAYDGPGTYDSAGSEWDMGSRLIIPTYLKDLSRNRLLLRLWNQAFDALTSATQVSVIGFQLHPADALARQLFALALLRNINKFDIEVVAPANGFDYWEEFCYHIGRERRRVRKTFEEWLG